MDADSSVVGENVTGWEAELQQPPSRRESNLCVGKHAGSGVLTATLFLAFCSLSERLNVRKDISFLLLHHPPQLGFCHAHCKETALLKVPDEGLIAKSTILSTQILLMHLMPLDTACQLLGKHTNLVSMTLYTLPLSLPGTVVSLPPLPLPPTP